MKKILIVEDTDDLRTLLEDIVKSEEGYTVDSAIDGQDALSKCEETQFDLIFLDIVMPKMDGMEVLQKLRSNKDVYGNPKIIMLTNLSGDLSIEDAMNAGADDYQVKLNAEPDVILELVKKHLG